MLQVAVRFLPCILVKSGWREAETSVRASRDLGNYSKGEQLPARSNGCDTIERLSCLLTAK